MRNVRSVGLFEHCRIRIGGGWSYGAYYGAEVDVVFIAVQIKRILLMCNAAQLLNYMCRHAI